MALKLLKLGSSGADVKRWQYFLLAEKYEIGAVDGEFGKSTDKATKKFQADHGMEADGVVGNGTYAAAMQLGFNAVKGDEEDQDGPNWPTKPDFSPLAGNEARAKIFGKFSFRHAPTPDNPERIAVLNDWEEENIIGVPIPSLMGVDGMKNPEGKVLFHRKAADQLTALFKAWDKAKFTKLILTYNDAYIPRFVRGSRTLLSNHAFGSAFDINYEWNKLGHMPALKGTEGSVREMVRIAHEHGFYWGGHFTRLDGMHFEIAKLL